MPKRNVIKTDKPYRLKQVRGVWSAIDKKTGKSKSLKIQGTREEAEKLADIEWNQTDDTNAAFHLKQAEVHLAKANPVYLKYTWSDCFEKYRDAPNSKTGQPKRIGPVRGLNSLWKHEAINPIRNVRLIDTTREQLRSVAENLPLGYMQHLRTIHNFAVTHDLMPYQLLAASAWPKKEDSKPMSRAVTLEDHEQILKAAADESLPIFNRCWGDRGMTKAEFSKEWRDYLNFLWLVGCSQKDGADMTTDNINKKLNCIEYKRGKWLKPEKRRPVRAPIGPALRSVLKSRPKAGHLFPALTKIRTSERARIFAWFVDWLKLPKVSLHGYRFAMAERLDEGGASDKDRMNMLGHAGRDMSEHYAKNSDYVPQCADIIDGAKAA